jgi:hypothetical protein
MTADNIAKLSVVPQFQRSPDGKFLPGGTNGRPKGARAKASRDLLKQVRAYGPHAAAKLWQALEANERWAVELVLKYCLPPSRTVEFEDMEPDDLREAIRAGDISSAEAKDIATAIAKLAEVGELATIKERLAELEAALAERQR